MPGTEQIRYHSDLLLNLNFRGYYTFLHELGHVFGAHHDMDNANNRKFSYGYGNLFKKGTGMGRGYRTIMA